MWYKNMQPVKYIARKTALKRGIKLDSLGGHMPSPPSKCVLEQE